MFVSGSPLFSRLVALYAAIFSSAWIFSMMLKLLVRLPSSVQKCGPVRQPYCNGLLRRTYVLAGIGENAPVLNQCCGVGLETQGLPLTIRFPNCGKSPDMKVQRPATFHPPTTASTALGAPLRNCLPFPTGSSHTAAILKR